MYIYVYVYVCVWLVLHILYNAYHLTYAYIFCMYIIS